MSRPTTPLHYRTEIWLHRRRVHLGRWVWSITDGPVGPVIASGRALTQWRANLAMGHAAARCERKSSR